MINRFSLCSTKRGRIDVSVYACEPSTWYYCLNGHEFDVVAYDPTSYRITSGEYKDKIIPAVHFRTER